ncbi:unnamed protein product [Caenorhabditis auriculariae]|uniref:Uncharacterized protein n=1 Tax=Caenorhabditis auriculariae TaxID=2777116 RepID=A0A8S1HLI6_9PELO|nr:unnamed protein product [Caenorhabditis auriculariae]
MLWAVMLLVLVGSSWPFPVIRRPVDSFSDNSTVVPMDLNSTYFGRDFDLLEAILNGTTAEDEQRKIDPSSFISLRENDWRDAHEGRMIIWSLESQYHPDYGRTSVGNQKLDSERLTRSSQVMSFMILGSVIGFILYTYVSHVILMRKLRRLDKTSHLRELVHRSALIMAGSAQQNDYDFTERRRSLINMFRAFKL